MKYLFKNFECFIANLEKGPRSARTIAHTVMRPASEKSDAVTAERPSFIPSGMDSFMSANGVIEVKKTISSGGMELF